MAPPKLPAPKNSAESVKVVIRCRPLNEKETTAGYERIVDMDSKRGIVSVKNPKAPREAPKTFTFDAVYDWNSKQIDLYDETFRPIVDSVLEGFNGTIFAYGQTGTGKTFTMEGIRNDPNLRGVIPNSFDHIFSHIARSHEQQFLVRASYLEIYMEDIRDLLHKDQSKKLDLKERPDTGVYVKDLSSFVTKSVQEIDHVMNVGNKNRSVGSTLMNATSSRSHAIFVITVECSEVGPDGEPHIRVGKLNLVDLAGSERQGKTGAKGERLQEATKINLSLSALGNVISALVDGKSSHIPYRDSKLTRLLQDSLGGNAKTIMVANVGPAEYNFDETITTLRYANRAKSIKNKPKINEDPKDALLREFQEEIARLKEALGTRGGGGGGKGKGKKKKKKTRIGPDGTEIEEDDDDEAEADPAMLQQMMEEERKRIEKDTTKTAAEKEKLLKERKKKEDELKVQTEAKGQLEQKIKAMESKLLSGGKNIIDHTNDQQRELERKRLEIAEQKRKEREMEQKLEEQEEMQLKIGETFTSLQQEVEIKTKKLKKLFAKLQAAKQEIQDLQDGHTNERQELEQTQEELTRELKLKVLIIENFIPPDEKEKIENRSIFDEDADTWKLQPLTQPTESGARQMEKRPQSAVGDRRPCSAYAKQMAQRTGNPRFKGENIMLVELDMPTRTTRDYEGPQVAPRVQAALEAAFKDDDDIEINAGNSVFAQDRRVKKNIRTTGGGGVRPARPAGASSQFPTARGLVPK